MCIVSSAKLIWVKISSIWVYNQIVSHMLSLLPKTLTHDVQKIKCKGYNFGTRHHITSLMVQFVFAHIKFRWNFCKVNVISRSKSQLGHILIHGVPQTCLVYYMLRQSHTQFSIGLANLDCDYYQWALHDAFCPLISQSTFLIPLRTKMLWQYEFTWERE